FLRRFLGSAGVDRRLDVLLRPAPAVGRIRRIDLPVRDRRRAGKRVAEEVGPELLAGLRVEGEDGARFGVEDDGVVLDHRRAGPPSRPAERGRSSSRWPLTTPLPVAAWKQKTSWLWNPPLTKSLPW